MAASFDISLGMNTKEIAAGAKVAEDAIEKITDALDDLADASTDADFERAGDDIEDSARDARREIDKTERSMKDLGRAGKTAGDDIDDGMRRAEGGLKDFKSESDQTARESAASFDGSAESIVDAFQEVSANAFSGFGVAGQVAGIAGAAGIGLITAAFVEAEEERARLEERASELANAYIDAGSTVLDEMAVMAGTNEVLTSTDQNVKDNLRDLTKALGDRSLAARALAGDQNALAAANALLASTDEEYIDLTKRQASGYTELSQAETQRLRDLQLMRTEVGELNAVQGMAEQNFRDSQAALMDLVAEAGTATEEVDGLGNRLLTLPSGVQVLIDAETGQATTDVSNFKGDLDGVPETINTTVKVNVDSSAWDRYTPQAKQAYIYQVNVDDKRNLWRP